MKDTRGTIQYKGKEYKLIFNLNVMEQIQEEYGTLDKWGDLTDGVKGEVNAKAVIYGFTCMINEGIEIANEENGTDEKPMTLKQVGRLISEVGMKEASQTLNNTVVDSTQSAEKNG